MIRKSTLKDAKYCSDIVIRVIKKSANIYYKKDQVSAWLKTNTIMQWKNHINNDFVFVKEIEGKIIGLVSFKDSEIKALYVDSEFIGKGIGKELLTFAEKKISGKVILTASLNSVDFYKKNGYKPIKKVIVRLKGVELPCIDMEKLSSVNSVELN